MLNRKVFSEYKSEFIFGSVLLVCVALSCWLAHYIPADLYCNSISNIMDGCITTIGLAGAWLLSRHINGMRVRIIWIGILIVYAALSITLLMDMTSFVDAPKRGIVNVEGWQMAVGDFLLWLLLLYPTEVLRPGWLTLKRALLQCLPIAVAYALDELFDFDLRILLVIYPLFLLGFLIRRIREYKKWCEENYSSMESIDVQWIVRYIIMFLMDCALFCIFCFDASIPTTFTHQWFIILILGYSTEQIMFRKDPMEVLQGSPELPGAPEEEVKAPTGSNAEYREALEAWLEQEKPYTNPEFRLLDMRHILPMNRTYLSQFIKDEYGCNFYQFVTRYRIEEAKRLMTEHPDMQLQEVGEKSGFSSPTVFSRIFSRETGMPPREWNRK